MTGEITLRGRVLPVGGIKEKILAAHRGGIKKIILPKENEKDLKDIPESIAKQLSFILVEHMDEVLTHALILEPGTRLFNGNDLTFDIIGPAIAGYSSDSSAGLIFFLTLPEVFCISSISL